MPWDGRDFSIEVADGRVQSFPTEYKNLNSDTLLITGALWTWEILYFFDTKFTARVTLEPTSRKCQSRLRWPPPQLPPQLAPCCHRRPEPTRPRQEVA